MSILSLIIIIPLAGAVGVLFVPDRLKRVLPWISGICAGLPLVLSLAALLRYDPGQSRVQLVERVEWIPSVGISFFLGLDGMSAVMLLLTAILCCVAFFDSLKIKERIREYFFFFLLLEASLFGVFLSFDLFLLYAFWGLSLIPLYFLIGIWGGNNKEQAAMKFILYSLAGGACLLLGILGIYFLSEPHSFDLTVLAQSGIPAGGWPPVLVFAVLCLGCAVIIPVVPFHSWMPSAHDEAPTPVTVILTGIYGKIGLYIFLRVICTVLPAQMQRYAFIIVSVAVIQVIYGSLIGLARKDMKMMVACSTMSQTGFILMGISSLSAAGFNGAVFLLFSHGLFASALLFLLGDLQQRAGSLAVDRFGGLGSRVPVLSGYVTTAVLAVIGLPGFAGFIGIFLCLVGIFPVYPIAAACVIAALLVTAGCFLRMIERVFLGQTASEWNAMPDISRREICIVAPLLVLTVLFGICPAFLLNILNATMVLLSKGF